MSFWDSLRSIGNSLPFTGGITSSIWGDPSQEKHQRSFDQAKQMLDKQRAYNMDARGNMLNQGALAFGPRNQMLGQMMGQRGPDAQAMDLSQILKNPMGQAQQDDIRNAAFGGGGSPQQPGQFKPVMPNPNTQGPTTGPSMGQGQMGVSGWSQPMWKR